MKFDFEVRRVAMLRHQFSVLIPFFGAPGWSLRLAHRTRCTLALLCFGVAAKTIAGQDLTLLFGTHVAGSGKGFSASSFDSKTGLLSKPEFVAEAAGPAYFVLTDSRKRCIRATRKALSAHIRSRMQAAA